MYIYIYKIKQNEKSTIKKKTSKFKCNEVSVLIIWVSISASNPGDGVPDVVL
jgi:hypothetical protein